MGTGTNQKSVLETLQVTMKRQRYAKEAEKRPDEKRKHEREEVQEELFLEKEGQHREKRKQEAEKKQLQENTAAQVNYHHHR